MPRNSAGCDQQHIDPHIFAGSDETRSECVCRSGNPAEAVGIDCGVELGRRGAPLHFDEGHRAVPAGDQVYLSARGFQPFPDDPPAF